MKRISQKYVMGFALFLILTPVFAIALGTHHVMNNGISPAAVSSLFGLWFLTGMGITVGYHRLFSHRSYKAAAPVRFILLILGGAA
jgi:stearoyl-CoA desaturase (delta-9 desaturase)